MLWSLHFFALFSLVCLLGSFFLLGKEDILFISLALGDA